MEKILALRREQETTELQDEELQEIALASGLSSEDLEYARKSLQDHRNRGKGFLQYENWERAARELEHVVALSPNDSSALVDLGIALWNSGVAQKESQQQYRAMQYAERALQLDSTNSEAVRLITHMTELPDTFFNARKGHGHPAGKVSSAQTSSRAQKKLPLMVALSAMIAALGAGLVFMMNVNDQGSSTPSAAPVTSPTESPSSDAPPADAPQDEPEQKFGRQVMSFGSKGIGPGKMEDVRHVALDGSGNIYAGEYGSGRIQKFTSDGTPVTEWNIEDDSPMRGLAVSRDGTVYVVFGGRIHTYDGNSGESLGELKYSGGRGFDAITTTQDGGLIAFWRGIKRDDRTGIRDDLIRFDRNGKVEKVIENGISSVSNKMAMNVALAANGEGTIYALDSHTNVVYVFSRDGRFINQFGGTGSEPGQFAAPGSLVVDGLGRVYVGDMGGVHVFDKNGRFIDTFPVDGTVSGMVINDQDQLFIASRVKVLQFDVRSGE